MHTCTHVHLYPHAAQHGCPCCLVCFLFLFFLSFINYYYMPSACTLTPHTSSSTATSGGPYAHAPVWPTPLQVCFIFFFSLTTYYTTFAHSPTAATIPTTHNHLDMTMNGGTSANTTHSSSTTQPPPPLHLDHCESK